MCYRVQAPGGRYAFNFRDADYHQSAVSLAKSLTNFSRPIRRRNANRLVPDAHASSDRLPLAHQRPFDSVASTRNRPRRSRVSSFASCCSTAPALLENPTRDRSELPLQFSVAVVAADECVARGPRRGGKGIRTSILSASCEANDLQHRSWTVLEAGLRAPRRSATAVSPAAICETGSAGHAEWSAPPSAGGCPWPGPHQYSSCGRSVGSCWKKSPGVRDALVKTRGL